MTRVLILSATNSYRTDDFVRAAERLGVEALVGTDRCHVLAGEWPREAFGTLPLDLPHTDQAVQQILDEARARPFDALVPTDDQTSVIAARAAATLGLAGNSPEAVYTARNKGRMREALARHGVPCPTARLFAAERNPEEVAAEVSYPCVVKPLLLSMSRGVIRADERISFAAAWRRLRALLETPALRAVEDPAGRQILVEDFVPGAEVAVEGLLRGGRLTLLALFDKPDPLDGPFFEETIYVTPSRHPLSLQQQVAEVTARAAEAIGLREGPVHAELRLPPSGRSPVVLEVAARSIGGLCSRTLRFAWTTEDAASLEEVVLAQALGRELGPLDQRGAAGVMMVPVPGAGVLQQVHGQAEARAVALVEDVVITARTGEVLVPPPEGASYPGFLFARGESPAAVETALREAHRCLRFELAPRLPAG